VYVPAMRPVGTVNVRAALRNVPVPDTVTGDPTRVSAWTSVFPLNS
jgi:hypothetical protein